MSRPDAPPAGSKRTSARRWTLLRFRKEARSSTSKSARLRFGRGRRGIVEDLGAVAILRIALPLWWASNSERLAAGPKKSITEGGPAWRSSAIVA
jgi:hypothetical protein